MKIGSKIIWRFALLIISFLVSFQIFAQENNEREDSLKFYASQSFKYYSQDSFNRSFRYINKSLLIADSIDDLAIIGRLYGLSGYIYLNRGATVKAIEAFGKSKNIGIKLDNVDMQIGGYHGLGRVYISLREFDKAYDYLAEGLRLAEISEKERPEAILNNALGILEQDRGNLSAALQHFNKFENISRYLNDTLSVIYAKINIGEIFVKLGNSDSALYYINSADVLNAKVNNAQARAAIFGNYGRLMYKVGEYEKSIEFINKSMKVSFDNKFSDFIIENYYVLIDDYQALHDSNRALKLYEELDHYKDSIFRINDLKKSEGLQAQFLLEEKAAMALYWQEKYNNRNLILALLIAVSLLIIVLLFMLSKRYKANKLVHQEETRNLNQTIDEKNRELVTRIMSENQRESTLEELSKTLEYLSHEKDVEKIKGYLTEALRNISSKEHVNSNWGVFKVHFEKVHPTFFIKLKKIQPDLTQSEMRLCAYIKMSLTTKEIANLLNISDRSIQTNRYRLKKKLGLDTQLNLISYIQSV